MPEQIFLAAPCYIVQKKSCRLSRPRRRRQGTNAPGLSKATSPRPHQLPAQMRFYIGDHRGIRTHEYEYMTPGAGKVLQACHCHQLITSIAGGVMIRSSVAKRTMCLVCVPTCHRFFRRTVVASILAVSFLVAVRSALRIFSTSVVILFIYPQFELLSFRGSFTCSRFCK